MFAVLKPFYGILISFVPQKGVGAFIWGNILYISLLHYTGIIVTSTLIPFQLPISVVFWQASPVSVWTCEGAELHYSHKKNMSCQACSMFGPNSDYIWECHIL